MTLLTTHIALESLIVWFAMGKKNRTIFKKRLGLFAGLTLFAAFPDLDVLFYIHRTYLHSIIWPLLIITGVLSYLSYMKLVKKSELGEKADLITRSIIISSVFILLHSFLDLNPGNVLLFYPIDNRLYSWRVSVIWDLDSFFYISKIKSTWTSISLTEGLSSSPLFNLTPAQRIQYFGTEFIEIFIGEFPLHFLLGLTWVVFFPGMAIYQKLKERKKPANFFNKISRFRNPLLAIGIITLATGLIVGPGFRIVRTETQQSTHDLEFSETTAIFGAAQDFGLDNGDVINLDGIYAGNTTYNDLVALIIREDDFLENEAELAEIFEFYTNESAYSYNWLVSNYKSTVQSLVSLSLVNYAISNETSTGVNYTSSERQILYSVVVLTDWNSSEYYNAQIQMTTTLKIKRIVEFSIGMTLTSLGIFAITSSILLSTKEQKNQEEQYEDPPLESSK